MCIRDSPKVSEKQVALDLGIPSIEECLNNEELAKKYKNKKWEKSFLENNFFENLDAVIILTEWDEFKEINFEEAFEVMKKPAWIFDGRNILDHQKLKDIGFEVRAIGKSI